MPTQVPELRSRCFCGADIGFTGVTEHVYAHGDTVADWSQETHSEATMKSLDVQDLLEYSRAAVAVLRTLQIKKTTMSYSDFARAIGLIESPDEKWQPWHRQQTEAILNATAAIEQKAGKQPMKLDYKRIVNKLTGQPGDGVSKRSAIVTT